jgi:hypothetical protein
MNKIKYCFSNWDTLVIEGQDRGQWTFYKWGFIPINWGVGAGGFHLQCPKRYWDLPLCLRSPMAFWF